MEKEKERVDVKTANIVLIVYALLLLLFTLFRVNNSNFWSDEAYTSVMVRQDWLKIIKITAGDVHPPLYYFYVKVMVTLFGDSYLVLRLSSWIPYAIVVYTAVTTISKKWGVLASAFFVTVITFFSEAVMYNVQVRMYSLVTCLLILSFYELINILDNSEIRYFCLFNVFSILAAYTHYYGLVAVAFLYAGLIVYAIIGYVNRKYVIISCVVAVASYVPWLIVLAETLSRLSSEGYWISNVPSIKECIKYILLFGYGYINIVKILLLVTVFVLYAGDIYKEKHFGKENYGLLVGLVCVAGTVIIGEAVSIFVLPVFLVRYIYPVTILFWLIISIMVGKLKIPKGAKLSISLLMMLLLVLSNYRLTSDMVNKDYRDNRTFVQTKSIVDNEIKNNTVIISDDSYALMLDYYPNNFCEIVTESYIPDLDATRNYVVVMTDEKYEKIILDAAMRIGCKIDLLVKDGNFGTKKADVYSFHP